MLNEDDFHCIIIHVGGTYLIFPILLAQTMLLFRLSESYLPCMQIISGTVWYHMVWYGMVWYEILCEVTYYNQCTVVCTTQSHHSQFITIHSSYIYNSRV